MTSIHGDSRAFAPRRESDENGSDSNLRRRYFCLMSTVELIEEKAKSLPGELQVEALHYVEFLLARMQARAESGEWAKFSAAQLEKQYGPADAIYDRD